MLRGKRDVSGSRGKSKVGELGICQRKMLLIGRF